MLPGGFDLEAILLGRCQHERADAVLGLHESRRNLEMDSRTTVRLTPSCAMISDSVGSLSPG